MSEICEIELLLLVQIDKEKVSLEIMDDFNYKSFCHKRLSVLYSLLNKLQVSNLEYVEKQIEVGDLY